MLFRFAKSKPLPAVMKMVVPGIRSLGQEWREVTVRPDPKGGFTIDNEEAKRPAMGQPVFIPALANLSNDEVDFILEGALARQQDEARHPRRQPVTDAEIHGMVQQLWLDYMEQKIHAFKGDSQFGPSGKTQRVSWGGPHEFNQRS